MKEWEEWQCLYARGIIPQAWIPKTEDIDYLKATVWESTNFKQVLDIAGAGYTDGAGAAKHISKSIAQVSFGAACFTLHPTGSADFILSNLACLGGQVPGRQTIPRAELWGAIQMLIRANPAAGTTIGIDAAYVTKGTHNRQKLICGPNGDLWSILYEIIDSRTGTTNLFKVQAHLDKKGPVAIQNKEIRLDHLIGNIFADQVAGFANNRVQLNPVEQGKALQCDKTGFNVAKRLAIIQADIWHKKGQDDYAYDLDFLAESDNTSQSVYNSSAMADLVQTGHILQRTQHGFTCKHCRLNKKLKKFKEWSSTPCIQKPPPKLIAKRRREASLEANANLGRQPPTKVAKTSTPEDTERPKEPSGDIIAVVSDDCNKMAVKPPLEATTLRGVPSLNELTTCSTTRKPNPSMKKAKTTVMSTGPSQKSLLGHQRKIRSLMSQVSLSISTIVTATNTRCPPMAKGFIKRPTVSLLFTTIYCLKAIGTTTSNGTR